MGKLPSVNIIILGFGASLALAPFPLTRNGTFLREKCP
jgi:hypothetical protein